MKKLSTAITALVLTASLAVTGCGSSTTSKNAQGSNSGSTTADKTENKQITLEWVAHPNYSASSTEAPRADYIKQMTAEFEKENPNIKLKGGTLSSSNTDEAMAKLYEQAAAGHAPDVAQIDGFVLPKFEKYLQPLDPYLEKEGIKVDDFFPFAQAAMKGKDGKIYGLYFNTDVRVLFYRKDLVPNPPKTMDELLTIGKKLKDQGYDALSFPGGRGEGSVITALFPEFWSQGGKLFDDQGKAVFGDAANKDKMMNVLNFYKKAVDEGIINKRVSTYKRENDVNAEVPSGKLAMFFGGNWQVSNLKQMLPKDQYDKWAVAPIPVFKEGDKPVGTAGGWTFGVFTKDPVKQEAAVKLLAKLFVGDKAMAKWNNITGNLPTRKSTYSSPDYNKDEFSNTFKDYLDQYAQVRPADADYGKVSQALQVALSEVTSGSKAPDAALSEAWEVVNKK